MIPAPPGYRVIGLHDNGPVVAFDSDGTPLLAGEQGLHAPRDPWRLDYDRSEWTVVPAGDGWYAAADDERYPVVAWRVPSEWTDAPHGAEGVVLLDDPLLTVVPDDGDLRGPFHPTYRPEPEEGR